MACSEEFIDFVCERCRTLGMVRPRKMFGDWMVYVNEKPLLLCCDNTVFIKKHKTIEPMMSDAECGTPYEGAKEHYIIDLERDKNALQVLRALEAVTPFPKQKRKPWCVGRRVKYEDFVSVFAVNYKPCDGLPKRAYIFSAERVVRWNELNGHRDSIAHQALQA